MGFNRLADQAIDAANPRTAARELPRGLVTRAEVWGFVLLSAATLVLAAAMLNRLCLMLSPVALAIVLGYSYAKRFTSLSHLLLGLALAIAPVGAWIAVRGDVDAPPVVLGFAVLAWVAGFDTIYSCQDADFDRAHGLHSVPARFGVKRALRFARGMHVAAVALLALVFRLVPLHPVYLGVVAIVAALLAYEHSLVRHDDLSRVDAAFFTLNGWISVAYLAGTAVAVRLATL
jgi:4-hydroxybenzoate polyprenyltransferase